jgi:hypothetical protein
VKKTGATRSDMEMKISQLIDSLRGITLLYNAVSAAEVINSVKYQMIIND